MPHYVIQDRDIRFTMVFWKALWSMLGTKMLFSSAYHPQTNGQTEHQNHTIEQLVRALVYEGYNWVKCLKLVKLALNNAVAELTGISPAPVTYGQSLRID